MNSHKIVSAGLLSLALAAVPLASALAQSQAGDPPGRVGRLAEVSGTVSFHTTEETQWAPASINYPVSGGNAFWTEPRSHAAIDVGASRLYMDSATELDVANVDDQSFTASLAQGAIYLRVSPAANGDQYEIDTPRGAVHIVRAGDYEVIAGDQDHPTTVMAFNGGVAEIVGPGVDAPVNSQQAVYISGQDQFQVNQGNAQQDDFITFVQAEEQPYQNQNAGPAPNYVSPEMTGYQDLNRYGQWGQDPSYGQVWYPQVAADWAPYRDGHWAYVAPWGWTWVDNSAWGFTPFHYGRWVQVQNRWAWWPGRREARPVYAPALVTFFGNIGGLNLALNIGGGQQNVGWIPLAPEEVYVPPYRHSPTYVRNVNITYVRNETTIINVVNNTTVINNYNNFHNRNGATVVNASTLTNSQPVAQDFHKIAPNGHLDSKQFDQAKITGGAPPVKPTNDTRGTTYKASVAPGPNVASGNSQLQKGKGKLPPLSQNTKYSQDKNGQGTNGQVITNGQNTNGQNTNGQVIKNGQVITNGQNLNGQNGNGQTLKNGQGVANGAKLPPLPNNAGQNNVGQNGIGQVLNGQNGNGQNGQKLKNGQIITNGQNLNGQNLNGQNLNGQNTNGQNQNNQTLKNGQGVANGTKLPPLPNNAGQNNVGQNGNGQVLNGQNGNGQNGQKLKNGQIITNGQNLNGQNLNDQNPNGQNLNNQTLKNGQGVANGNKLPPLPNGNGQNNKNSQGFQTGVNNGQNGNGQNLKNLNTGSNKQPPLLPSQNNVGQNGNGQNLKNLNTGNNKQPTLLPSQNNVGQNGNGQNFNGQNNGQNNNGKTFTQGGGNGSGPANQKVQQKKNNNDKGVIPPLDSNGQPLQNKN